jgi:hypothetical protein
MVVTLRKPCIAMVYQPACQYIVVTRFGRQRCCQAIHIAVVQAKQCGYKHGIVNLHIGCTELPSHALPIPRLHFFRFRVFAKQWLKALSSYRSRGRSRCFALRLLRFRFRRPAGRQRRYGPWYKKCIGYRRIPRWLSVRVRPRLGLMGRAVKIG